MSEIVLPEAKQSKDHIEGKIEQLELELEELRRLITAIYDLLQNTLLN